MTPSTSTSTMKPCPFCGEAFTHRSARRSDDYYEHPRNDCILAITGMGDPHIVFDDAEHIAAWNRRSPVEAQPSAVAGEARYSMDHGMLHDRVTGQHLYTQEQYDDARRGLTLSPEDAAFLAARLRRLFAHFKHPVPSFADTDVSVIGIAASCIGAILAAPSAVLPPQGVPIAVLRDHWLRALECDHEGKRDKPHCACCAVDLGWHPTVGRAVEAWLEHVASVGLPPTPAHNGHPMRHWDRTCPACIASIDNGAAGQGAAAPSVPPTQAQPPTQEAGQRLTLAAAPVETAPMAAILEVKRSGEVVRFATLLPYSEHKDEEVLSSTYLYARPAPAAGVPPGFVMVPLEPTEKMIEAGILAYQGKSEESYRAMLAARPLPGGAPTGLSDEQIDELWLARDCIGAINAGDMLAQIRWFARALLSAGAPSPLQGERK